MGDEWNGESIVILDFGSQYTQLIGRRVRSEGVFSVLLPHNATREEILENKPCGIILSGGPANVDEHDSPRLEADIFSIGVPILGICYGMHLIAKMKGAEVSRSVDREYGHTIISADTGNRIFNGTPEKQRVWMSHGVRVKTVPDNYEVFLSSRDCEIAGIYDRDNNVYGIQFHPEVHHTEYGEEILKNFLFSICGCSGEWNSESFIELETAKIREKAGNSKVLCAVSGGVDSSVMSALLDRAVGRNLYPVFVDNGLLRENEADEVKELLSSHLTTDLIFVDATDQFLSRLKGVTDAEEKRKIIGRCFIDVFRHECRRLGDFKFLAQGTLYPDVIESRSTVGPSQTIKSHHNVGGLPDDFDFELIEPLAWLFKDEVREVGKALGLPYKIIGRHPFPGPGLGVRIPGEITEPKLKLLRKADRIFIDKLREYTLYDQVWQAFAVLLPVKSVGVMGDERTYQSTVVLRAVTSVDGMTADWAKLPYEFLQDVSSSIINRVDGINRVVYDISSKPPSTIEWE